MLCRRCGTRRLATACATAWVRAHSFAQHATCRVHVCKACANKKLVRRLGMLPWKRACLYDRACHISCKERTWQVRECRA